MEKTRIRLNPMHHILGYVRVANKSVATRHRILRAHLRAQGDTNAAALHLIRRINVLSIFMKRKNPRLASIFRNDMKYAQRMRQLLSTRRLGKGKRRLYPLSTQPSARR